MSRQDRWSWFSGQQRPRCSKSVPRAPGRGFAQGRRLHVEPLEDRRMLAVITVTSLADNLFPGGGVTLREAIKAANDNVSVDGSVAGSLGADTIRFAAALSGDTITLGGVEQVITESLTIDGTTLANSLTIDANSASRIFNITDTTDSFTLAGLKLTGGRTTGDNVNSADTTFSGGAIRSLTTGSLTIEQSTVSGNSTTGDLARGGGIFSTSTIIITSSTVTGNSTTGGFADGGAIYSQLGVGLTSSTVSGNSTEGDTSMGGGVFSDGVVLTNSTVSGNSTAGVNAFGGGIRSSGDVTLTNSTVSGNSTAGNFAYGGGIFSPGTVTLSSSTVSGNSTTGSNANGGGILSSGDVTLTSSTVTDNHAYDANSNGGGIWNSAGTITITHSIVAGNTAGVSDANNNDIDPGTGSFTVDFSLLGINVTPGAGSSNMFTDTPALSDLADHGGPTKTHALLAGSLAIDAGSPAFDVAAIPTDQRGAPFTRGAGLRVDIGAYERQTLASLNLTVDTNVDENDGDFSTGELSLREAIALANGSVGDDTILFDSALSGATITLGGEELQITEAVTIDATALANHLTIDANNASRIFNISATTGDFSLAGLTLTGGKTVAGGPSNRGGAIRSRTTGNLTIDQSTISGNSTEGEFAGGGGIYSAGSESPGSVTITSSTVSGNSTAGYRANGGGIFSFRAVTLTSSTVSGNSTAGNNSYGGGILSYDTALTLTNSTVSGNSTAAFDSGGGGIFSSGVSSPGTVTLTSSTISGNSTAGANADGGGIFAYGNVTFNISHSIVAGNTVGGGDPDIHPGTGALNVNFSLIGVTPVLTIIGGNNVTNVDPQLGPLADNGGPTQTHALLPTSQAIDAGSPAYDVFAIPSDQRGAPFVRGFGLRVDIGAFEVQDDPVVLSADFDNDGDIDGGDFLAWQRGFGTPNANKPDGDADNDNDVDGVDLGIWETQFGQPAPVAAASELSAISDQPSAELIDAVMAFDFLQENQVAESPTLEEQTGFTAVAADLAFAAEVFAPAVVSADEAERPDTNSSEDDEAEGSWLADELLERVFG